MKPFRAVIAAIAFVALSAALVAPLAIAQSPTPSDAAPAKAAVAPKSGAASSIRTIVGEVVDPACWVVNGAKGETHKECLLACAKAGQVLAILEAKTNKLYLIATDNPGEDPNKGVIDFAAQKVTVTGKFYTRGGVTAVKISSITPGGK